MLDRLKKFLREDDQTRDAAGEGASHGIDEVQLAAAALLMEAAGMDGSLGAEERDKIEELIAARYGTDKAEIDRLLTQTEERLENTHQILPFTRVVKDRLEHEERIEVLEMLWEVVYADGELHDYEANLMRRVAGLIYVTDRESGEARKRALAKLGLER